MARLLTCLLLLAGSPAFAADDAKSALEPRSTIRIGVLESARPYIWKDEDSDKYNGFFWDLCTKAAHRANYDIRVVPLDASDATKRANTPDGQVPNAEASAPEPGASELTTPETLAGLVKGNQIDIVCSPTMATLKHMRKFAEFNSRSDAPSPPSGGSPGKITLSFSPIVFVADFTYFVREKLQDRPKNWGELPETAMTELTKRHPGLDGEAASKTDQADPSNTSCRRVRFWLESSKWLEGNHAALPDWPNGTYSKNGSGRFWSFRLTAHSEEELKNKWRYQFWGYIEKSLISRDFKNRHNKNESGRHLYCMSPFETYAEAAEEFCAGKLDRLFGDAEMVMAGFKEREEHGHDCGVAPGRAETTVSWPYAFVMSRRGKSRLPERITHALYSMFQDGTVQRLYAGHFPGKQASQDLSTLFRINAIPKDNDVFQALTRD